MDITLVQMCATSQPFSSSVARYRHSYFLLVQDIPISTPIYQQHAVTTSQQLASLPSSNLSQQPSLSQVPYNPSREENSREPFDAYGGFGASTGVGEDNHSLPFTSYLVSPPPSSPTVPQSPSPHYGSQTHITSPNKPMRDRDTQSLRRSPLPNQPIVSNILRALEPPNVEAIPYSNRSASEDGYSTVEMPVRDPRDYGERRERKPFWAWDRARDGDRGGDKSGRDRGRDFQRKDDEAAASVAKMIGKVPETCFLPFLIFFQDI